MSFGMDDVCHDTKTAIEDALKENVILLAAAGNGGNCKGIPYPASEKDVFEIFASKPSGYAADFSAPSRPVSGSYSFFGCKVVSIWPSSILNTAKNGRSSLFHYDDKGNHKDLQNGCNSWTVMSGTSFASPLVAALVAVLYQFHEENRSDILRDLHPNTNFKSPRAVLAIFDRMSKVSDNAWYNFLEPTWGKDEFFRFIPGYHNEGQRKFFAGKLRDALKYGKV